MPSSPAICVVECQVRHNGTPTCGATVTARLIDENSAINDTILSTATVCVSTNRDGYAELALVRQDQFVDGDGKYLIEVLDSGNNPIWSVTTTIPNVSRINLEKLLS